MKTKELIRIGDDDETNDDDVVVVISEDSDTEAGLEDVTSSPKRVKWPVRRYDSDAVYRRNVKNSKYTGKFNLLDEARYFGRSFVLSDYCDCGKGIVAYPEKKKPRANPSYYVDKMAKEIFTLDKGTVYATKKSLVLNEFLDLDETTPAIQYVDTSSLANRFISEGGKCHLRSNASVEVLQMPTEPSKCNQSLCSANTFDDKRLVGLFRSVALYWFFCLNTVLAKGDVFKRKSTSGAENLDAANALQLEIRCPDVLRLLASSDFNENFLWNYGGDGEAVLSWEEHSKVKLFNDLFEKVLKNLVNRDVETRSSVLLSWAEHSRVNFLRRLFEMRKISGQWKTRMVAEFNGSRKCSAAANTLTSRKFQDYDGDSEEFESNPRRARKSQILDNHVDEFCSASPSKMWRKRWLKNRAKVNRGYVREARRVLHAQQDILHHQFASEEDNATFSDSEPESVAKSSPNVSPNDDFFDMTEYMHLLRRDVSKTQLKRRLFTYHRHMLDLATREPIPEPMQHDEYVADAENNAANAALIETNNRENFWRIPENTAERHYMPQPVNYTTQPPNDLPQPLNYTEQPPNYCPPPPNYCPPPLNYTTQPLNYTTQSPNYCPPPLNYTTQPLNYTTQPLNYTTQPLDYTTQPPNYSPQPLNYTTQLLNYTTQPLNYTMQPPNYSPQPLDYTTQPPMMEQAEQHNWREPEMTPDPCDVNDFPPHFCPDNANEIGMYNNFTEPSQQWPMDNVAPANDVYAGMFEVQMASEQSGSYRLWEPRNKRPELDERMYTMESSITQITPPGVIGDKRPRRNAEQPLYTLWGSPNIIDFLPRNSNRVDLAPVANTFRGMYLANPVSAMNSAETEFWAGPKALEILRTTAPLTEAAETYGNFYNSFCPLVNETAVFTDRGAFQYYVRPEQQHGGLVEQESEKSDEDFEVAEIEGTVELEDSPYYFRPIQPAFKVNLDTPASFRSTENGTMFCNGQKVMAYAQEMDKSSDQVDVFQPKYVVNTNDVGCQTVAY